MRIKAGSRVENGGTGEAVDGQQGTFKLDRVCIALSRSVKERERRDY